MKKELYLICMSFDGEFQTESEKFENIQDAWEHSNNLGSKWYFYPFHFVCKGKTIKEAGYGLTHFENKRITSIQKAFKTLQDKCDKANISMNAEEFWMAL
jgi:hypothetical protein